MIKIASWIYLLLILSLLPSPIAYSGSTKIHIYAYESPATESLLEYISKTGCEVIFYSLNESSAVSSVNKIVVILDLIGVEAAPGIDANVTSCRRCEIPQSFYAGVPLRLVSPLIGFFRNGRLTAITIGISKPEILDEAFKTAGDDYMKVFTPQKEYSITDENARALLEELFLEEYESKIETLNIPLTVTLLAVADSINPCTFTVFTALLFITLYSLGKSKTVLTGLSFITAIFLSYYALGLGLIHLLVAIPYMDKIVAAAGFAIGLLSITRGLKPSFKSPIPRRIRRFLERHIEKSYASPILSFALGIIVSFTLLPCSSGPYIVSLGLLSLLKDHVQARLLLALYNLLFVTPLMLVLLAVLASRLVARKIKMLKSRRLGVMELINGSILTAICIYIIFSS